LTMLKKFRNLKNKLRGLLTALYLLSKSMNKLKLMRGLRNLRSRIKRGRKRRHLGKEERERDIKVAIRGFANFDSLSMKLILQNALIVRMIP